MLRALITTVSMTFGKRTVATVAASHVAPGFGPKESTSEAFEQAGPLHFPQPVRSRPSVVGSRPSPSPSRACDASQISKAASSTERRHITQANTPHILPLLGGAWEARMQRDTNTTTSAVGPRDTRAA